MQRNGVKVVASVEIDKHCQTVLSHQFPDVKIFDDVTTVKGSDLIAAGFEPSTGIITGGFPCQDLSVAGKRAGLAGERSGLFWEIARIVEETQSEYFLIENVPGLLSSNKGRDFGVVIGTMADLGYSIGWRVLDAQYFGVPQRRRRVFIVGRRSSSNGVAEVLFESKSVRRNTTQSQQTGQDAATSTTRSTTTTSLGSGKDIANTIPAELYHHGSVVNQDANNGHVVIETTIVGTLQARDYKGVNHEGARDGHLVVTSSSFGGYTEGVGTLRSSGGDLGGGSETLVVHKE
jgi:DNA (cytosine-5)-methyltransferase 1